MKSRLSQMVCTALMCLIGHSTVHAWDFSVQVRPRTEARNGYRTLPYENGPDGIIFVSQRTRFIVSHQADERVGVRLELQDVRTWGSEASTLADYSADYFDLHQGFVDITPNQHWAFRAGRQELAYDGHRILGSVNWTQQGRAQDAVRVAYMADDITAHLVLAHSESEEGTFSTPYTNPGNYRDLVALWTQRRGTTYQASALLLIDDYASNTNDRYPTRFTFGPRIAGTLGPQDKIIYRGEFYYQAGTACLARMVDDQEVFIESDIAAFLLGLRLGYDMGNVVVTGWFDWVSGDGDMSDDRYEAFDTPYPTNHKFYGWADYFLHVPNDTRHLGLQDYAVKFKVKRLGPFSGQLDGHYFRLARADAMGDRNLGWEVDAALHWPVTKGTTLSAGFSHVDPEDALGRLKLGDSNADMAQSGNWGWIMLAAGIQ